MPRIYVGIALCIAAVAIVGYQWHPLAAFFLRSPDTFGLSTSTHFHTAKTITSIGRTIIATPCMFPALSHVPIACTTSIVPKEEHETCLGLVEVLLSQRALAQRISFDTHGHDAVFIPVRILLDLNATVLRPGLLSDREGELAPLRRRWLQGMLDLVIHLELTVARITSINLAVRNGANEMSVLLGIFGGFPKVMLRKAMEIALEGMTDSVTYLRSSIDEARSLTAELRDELQHDESATRAVFDDDRDSAILVAVHLLTALDDSLQSLREDADETVDRLVFDAPRTFGALTCPVRNVDALLSIHDRALQGLVDSLDRLRVSISV